MGLAVAEAVDRALGGDPDALRAYAQTLLAIREICRERLARYYADEVRWADRLFWRRSHARVPSR